MTTLKSFQISFKKSQTSLKRTWISLKGCSKNQAVLIFQRFLSDFVFNAAEAQQAMVQGVKDNGAKKIEKAYRQKKASQNFKT